MSPQSTLVIDVADAGSPWSVWGGLIGALTTAISLIVGGAIAVFGMVWRGGRSAAARAADIAALSISVAKHDQLERRVAILEGQQSLVAARLELLSGTVNNMRTEMADGFDGLRSRQDRMLEAMARTPG